MVEEYKKSESDKYPTNWEIKNIEDLSIKVGSGQTPTGGERVYKTQGRYFIRSQNVGWGKLILNDVAFIDEQTHNSFNSTEIFEQDVLLNITGASIGRSAIANSKITGGNVNQHVCIIRASKSNDPEYLNHFLLSNYGQKQIGAFQAGGNRQGLNFSQIKSLKVPIPPTKTEQTAIATALNDADNLILALEQLIAKKKAIKQGAMQELLKPKKGWEAKKLGNIIQSMQLGGNYTNSDRDNGLPLIKMGNIQRGKISLSKVEYIINDNTRNVDKLEYGDLLFNTRNTLELVGKVAIWRNELPLAYFNSNLMRIKFKENIVASNFFMNALFNTKYIIGLLKDIAIGTTSVAAIYTRDLINLEIKFPNVQMQQEIAQILSDMDAEIDQLEKRLEKQKHIKQGMMQVLLTGKIRLI
jgi:type I restriction enzyme S subunit